MGTSSSPQMGLLAVPHGGFLRLVYTALAILAPCYRKRRPVLARASPYRTMMAIGFDCELATSQYNIDIPVAAYPMDVKHVNASYRSTH